MRRYGAAAAVLPVLLLVGLADPADANGRRVEFFLARLVGYSEVPTSLSTPARGWLRLKVQEEAGTIEYWLSYDGFPTDVSQAHIHFGQNHTVGGVSAFLCTNLGNGPAGTPACPTRSGEVNGTIRAAQVVGPAGQGIAAGEFGELVAAIRARAAYGNVHSMAFPAGEIRGQLGKF